MRYAHLYRLSVLIEKRKGLKIDYILAVDGIALSEYSHLADDFTTRLLYKVFKRKERATGRDNVVNDKDTLTLDILCIITVDIEGLLCLRGD